METHLRRRLDPRRPYTQRPKALALHSRQLFLGPALDPAKERVRLFRLVRAHTRHVDEAERAVGRGGTGQG